MLIFQNEMLAGHQAERSFMQHVTNIYLENSMFDVEGIKGSTWSYVSSQMMG